MCSNMQTRVYLNSPLCIILCHIRPDNKLCVCRLRDNLLLFQYFRNPSNIKALLTSQIKIIGVQRSVYQAGRCLLTAIQNYDVIGEQNLPCKRGSHYCQKWLQHFPFIHAVCDCSISSTSLPAPAGYCVFDCRLPFLKITYQIVDV